MSSTRSRIDSIEEIRPFSDHIASAMGSSEGESGLVRLLEALPVAVFVADANGTPLYANQAAVRILGQGVRPELTTDQLAEAYQAFVAGTDELYPTQQL